MASTVAALELATYDFSETFHRKFDVSNTFGKYYLAKGPDPDSQPRLFSANIVAEVGSEAEGTRLSACNKTLPASKLPLRNESQPQCMIIAARCPTGTPPELQVLFRDFLGTADAFRGADIADKEKRKDVVPKANDPVEKPPPPTRQRNIKSTAAAPATPDVSMDGMDGPLFPDVDDRKVGDMYPPGLLSDHRGECYAHTKVMMPECNIRNPDDKLIAPHEIYSQLTDGTLFNAIINFETFVYRDQYPTKTYQIFVERISIMDKGYGPTWSPPILSMPAPVTPKRTRCEPDATVEDTFNNLKSVSPTKKTRRN
ncbi:hypothetical protein B0H14DRAFT_3905111 [Mycena olivaceomarginata]|nr:hypothetical protein B0H14DRAFT_3905111 [Mycena olivaceomarginata]